MSSLTGSVRGVARPNVGEGTTGPLGLTNGLEQLVALGSSLRSENVRRGDTWMCSIATGSAFTHVAAWPTTRAELVLYNGEPSNGKSYIIEQAWAANVATSIAAAATYTLLGQVVPTGTAPADDSAQLIVSQSGRASYGGLARRAVANTSYGVASKWQVLANSPAGPAASIGLSVIAQVDGGIIIRPGGLLLLNLVTGTATGTASIGVVWTETYLNLG